MTLKMIRVRRSSIFLAATALLVGIALLVGSEPAEHARAGGPPDVGVTVRVIDAPVTGNPITRIDFTVVGDTVVSGSASFWIQTVFSVSPSFASFPGGLTNYWEPVPGKYTCIWGQQTTVSGCAISVESFTGSDDAFHDPDLLTDEEACDGQVEEIEDADAFIDEDVDPLAPVGGKSEIVTLAAGVPQGILCNTFYPSGTTVGVRPHAGGHPAAVPLPAYVSGVDCALPPGLVDINLPRCHLALKGPQSPDDGDNRVRETGNWQYAGGIPSPAGLYTIDVGASFELDPPNVDVDPTNNVDSTTLVIGIEACNGVDDDADTSIDEGCEVGGVAELVDVAPTPLESESSASALAIAAIGLGVAGGAFVLGGSAWYARRRWLR